ncbi:MAG: short-chain dehydrogenase [SAR324 cluster bacterium]|uniref:Short-chain dehydrogenase n=1 Tax=SAR324 cluster bacterium TaxID=2024889 RepID=A0A2A4SRJ9_9DELT|nr:MAG: short-chain dehydrogenase [SAR324 cluster bacterium]
MNLLILGGNSDIGFAIAKEFARKHRASVQLASRNLDQLNKKAKDLEVSFQVETKVHYFDVLDTDSHKEFYTSLETKPDMVIATFGILGDQHEAQADPIKAIKIIESNYVGAVSILELIAADFEKKQKGTIVGVSSVAGERGRGSNYIYGSAKAGFTAYFSGLRNRLHPAGVRVITLLPGFVKTKMTAHLELPQALLAEPAEVAIQLEKAYRKGKDVVYAKPIWKWIMMAIKLQPEGIFKRLKL